MEGLKRLMRKVPKKKREKENKTDSEPNKNKETETAGARWSGHTVLPQEDPLVVVAIDFGTTYTGYAFSFKDSPTKIHANLAWPAGSQLVSWKTATCVLLKPNKEFDSFGYEAENKFAELAEDDKHHDWYLFRNFKMLLHNNQGLTRESVIQDINNQSMPAMTIFAMAISYIKKHFLQVLFTRVLDIKETDVRYVLTVPAIWSDNAKQFMREAGIMAGIDSDKLVLALEPEAASVWCQTVQTEIRVEFGQSLTSTGTAYMVIDLGGGTADISVHERLPDKALKQLHKASGGPWGGNVVNENFLKWLADIIGEKTMETFKREQILDYFDIHREFENKKRALKFSDLITFKIPASLQEIFKKDNGQDIADRIANSSLADKVKCKQDKLRVDASIVKRWFDEPIEKTVEHVKNILGDPKMAKVNVILLVGGFSECSLVQDKMKTHISSKQLIVPNEAGLAVVKGAVIFGHSPNVIASRIAPCTYGMNTTLPFDPKIHPCSKLIISDGRQYADDIFGVFVRYGEEIMVGHEEKRIITPTMNSETNLRIFTSNSPSPVFIDEPGCQQIGYLKVSHPGQEPKEDKEFEVTFFFGETDLHVKAKLIKTNKECATKIDCL